MKRRNIHNSDRDNKRVNVEINTIDSLLRNKHLLKSKINMRIFTKLEPTLEQLNSIIGLEKAKSQLLQNIFYLLRGLGSEPCNSCIDCDNYEPCVANITDKFHTVIYGPPGVGKTTFAKILGQIYAAFGNYREDIKIVSRSDLISGYLGRTAKKTQKVIDSVENGVLFIDEAYSLGSESSNEDTYAKECIDTLNLNLTEGNFICIIAGYKEELDKCFFSKNIGLQRRFRFYYELDGYTPTELYKICLYMMNNNNWKIEDSKYLEKVIANNYVHFKYYGGSIENLLAYIKICHASNFNAQNKVLQNIDIDNGMKLYLQHTD